MERVQQAPAHFLTEDVEAEESAGGSAPELGGEEGMGGGENDGLNCCFHQGRQHLCLR